MIFDAAVANDVSRIERFVNKFGNDVNERNEDGLTCLHICASKGNFEGVCCLLELGAQFGLQDFENGWTALHYSIYYNHPRISLMLIQYGAVLDVEVSHSKDAALLVDKDGLNPLQLLSTVITSNQKCNINQANQTHGNIVSYGKSDIVLGVPLPKAVNVLRPKRLDSLLNENIIAISSAKYHNLAVCAEGNLWSWGHGKGGKLGHGDECSQPEPRLIHFPLLRIKIVQVSAAETHSLALTANGDVYSWGSDRFGQCAGSSNHVNTSSHRSTAGSIETHRMYTHPTRIEALRKENVLGIAAGESHSLCFTSNNEVFAWGNNKRGQLALRFTDTTAGNAGQQVNTPKKVKLSLSTAASSGGVGGQSGNFGSLSGQNSGQGGGKVMTIVQVIAGQNSSLLLTRSLANSYGNSSQDRHHGIRIGTLSEVYQWGDGVFQPRKIHFPRTSQSRSRENSIIADDTYHSSLDALTIDHSQINMICAGKHHFLALSKAGSVYSWGLGVDQLGHGIDSHITPNHLSVPMVIEALHPDRTKSGKVVFIAAAGNRSAAVTTLGEVFSWGTTSNSNNNVGHYRPLPQREQGIRRAVKVSLTEDSTFVLASASIPSMPVLYPGIASVKTNVSSKKRLYSYQEEESEDGDNDDDDDSDDIEDEHSAQVKESHAHVSSVPSLQAICQTQLCSSVNMKNVIDALLFSEQHCSFILERYCLEFISLNLDALLVQLKPKNLDRIAMEWSLPSLANNRKPSWDHSANAGETIKSSSLKSLSFSPNTASVAAIPSLGRRQSSSRSSSGSNQKEFPYSSSLSTSRVNDSSQGPSRKNLEAVETVEEMQRLIRSTKKKLVAIDDIIQGDKEKMLTPEQREKVNKKAGLQLDLMKMEQMLVRLQQREQRNATISPSKAVAVESSKAESNVPAKPKKEQLAKATSSSSSASSNNKLPSFDQWSAMLMTEEEQVMYLLQQTALDAAPLPSPVAAVAPPTKQQQVSQPKAVAWSTINNNKQSPPLSQQAASSSQHNQTSPISNLTTLSSSTPNGRTVLSPPEPPAFPAAKQQQQQQARVMTKPNSLSLVVAPAMHKAQVQSAPAAAGKGEEIPSATSLRATFETSCSLADFITPKKSVNAAKKIQRQQQLLGVSSPAAEKMEPLLSSSGSATASGTGNKPVVASSPWGKSSAIISAATIIAAAIVPSSSSYDQTSIAAPPSSSSMLITPVKHKKLSDIVAEEERARENSNMTTLRGNDIPWLIERKPRAASFERLVAEQLCAKQDEEERLLKEAADAALAAEKKQKKKEKSKEKRKEKQQAQQRDQGGKGA